MIPTDSLYSNSFVTIGSDSVYLFGTAPDTIVEKAEEGFAFCLDSIFRLRDTIEVIQRSSIFNNHELTANHNQLIFRVAENNNMWLFGIITAVIILLTIVLRTQRVKVGTLMQACVVQRKMDVLMRENAFTRFTTLFQSIFFFSLIVATLPYYLWNNQPNPIATSSAYHNILEYAMMAGVCTIILLLRQGLTYWLGKVFNNKESIRYYMGNTQIYAITDTIILLPFSLLLFFSPLDTYIVSIALFITSLLLIIRIIRGMIIILSVSNDSKLYLFYYLCTVEIVPILIIAKLISH